MLDTWKKLTRHTKNDFISNFVIQFSSKARSLNTKSSQLVMMELCVIDDGRLKFSYKSLSAIADRVHFSLRNLEHISRLN